MAIHPQSEKEFERVLRLSEYDIDYSGNNPLLNDLSKLAAHVAGMPISQINILGPNTQWSLSSFGMDIKQMPKDETICQFTLEKDDFFEANNLEVSEQFKDQKYVRGNLGIRYYFGVPIRTDDGFNIGSVCVMDQKPNSLAPEKLEMMQIISQSVVSILEQKKTVRELSLERDELEENRRKLSHDIRGPIGGIIGLSNIAKEQLEEKNYSDIENINSMILSSSKSVIDLADEILSEVTHKDEVENRAEFVTLQDLKEKLISLYNPQAITKNIDFIVETDIKNLQVKFSRKKLLQIIGNLISNALKFTSDSGCVQVKLSIEEIEEKHILNIKVEDNGIGMLQSQIENMLRKGDHISSEGTNKERGYGFGFQLAKHLIESMKGIIDIKSTQGKGTTISVTLGLISHVPDN